MGGEWKEFKKQVTFCQAEHSRVSKCPENVVTGRRCGEPRLGGADLAGHAENGAGFFPILRELDSQRKPSSRNRSCGSPGH